MWAGWVHHSWRFRHVEALREVGPEMPERGSKTSTMTVVWAPFRIFSARSKWFSVANGDHGRNSYITMTRRQSNNQWSGGILVHPAQINIPSAKIRWKSSCLDFLGSRRYPPHWIFSKGPNYQRGVLFISAGATEGHFEGKTPREVHQRGSCSCTTMPPAHRAFVTQKKVAYLGFHRLDQPPYSP